MALDPLVLDPSYAGAISRLAARLHDPRLAASDGSNVTQIWHDGEITSQKCGELLWARTLHQAEPPLPGVSVPMPVVHGTGATYAFVADTDACLLRAYMALIAAEKMRIVANRLETDARRAFGEHAVALGAAIDLLDAEDRRVLASRTASPLS